MLPLILICQPLQEEISKKGYWLLASSKKCFEQQSCKIEGLVLRPINSGPVAKSQ
jgi:hypothetical protein